MQIPCVVECAATSRAGSTTERTAATDARASSRGAFEGKSSTPASVSDSGTLSLFLAHSLIAKFLRYSSDKRVRYR
jgi:hypothetical protein